MYNSPNYAHRTPKAGGGINAETALLLVASSFRVPVYEPIRANNDWVFNDAGDILIASQATAPLTQIP